MAQTPKWLRFYDKPCSKMDRKHNRVFRVVNSERRRKRWIDRYRNTEALDELNAAAEGV
jgi:hemerythrin